MNNIIYARKCMRYVVLEIKNRVLEIKNRVLEIKNRVLEKKSGARFFAFKKRGEK